MESGCSTAEERKKPRTAEAEADGACDDAGQVMGECDSSFTRADLGSDTNDSGSCPSKTANAEEENHMSVDVVIDDSVTVSSVSSDKVSAAVDLPSVTLRSISSSSFTDVIDVDAIDTEASCDEDNKDKSVTAYRNPQELGLNEFYLQPASNDEPADNVIDVDAETAESADDLTASLDTAAADRDSANAHAPVTSIAENEVLLGHHEEKPCGTEVATTSSEVSDTKSDEVLATAIVVKDQSTESVGESSVSAADESETSAVDVASDDADATKKLADAGSHDGPASDECTESQSTEPQVTSFIDRQSLDTADIGEMVTKVIDSVIESQEQSMVKDLVIGAHALVEIPSRGNAEVVEDTSNSDTESMQATVEVEMSAVHHSLPSTDQSVTVHEVDESGSESVERESVQERCHGDEKMIDAAVVTETDAVSALNEENTSLHENDNATDDTDDKHVIDTTGEYAAEVKELRDEPVPDTGRAASGNECAAEVMEVTDELVSDTGEVASAGECVAEVMEVIDMPVSGIDKAAHGGECVAEVVEVTDKLVSDTGNVASGSECVEEVMEVTDKPVFDTKDVTKSLNPIDASVSGGENVKESEDIISNAFTNTENIQQRSAELASATGDAVSDAVKIQQEAIEVKQHAEVADMADVLPSKEVTDEMIIDTVDDTKKLTAESITADDNLQSKESTEMALHDNADVSDSTELSQQPIETTAETGSGVSEKTADSDGAEVRENVVTVDEEMKHEAVDEKDEGPHTEAAQSETDVCLDQSTTLETVGGGVAASVEATGDELDQPTTRLLVDTVESVAADVQPTHSCVSSAESQHTTETVVSSASAVSVDLPTNSVEMTIDGSSAVGEMAGSKADAEFCEEKSEGRENEAMMVDSLTPCDEAAESM